MPEPDFSRALLTGDQLRSAWLAAAAHLRESAAAVDAINVYPVPDGDTGSNMSATLSEAVDGLAILGPNPPASSVLLALAKGALYGARGNSGVILSQALRGLADGVEAASVLDAHTLANGLKAASDAAYSAVSKPEEGTMLTVLRVLSEEATVAAEALPAHGASQPCLGLLLKASNAAEAAEAGTMQQLPALAEAGVPDAGGEGICVILRGLLGYLTGVTPAPPALPARPIASLAGHESQGFGFCTEFIIEAMASDIDPETVRALVSLDRNSSVVVVGDATAVRVHVHTQQPEDLLASVAALGKVQRAKIDDMTAQNTRFESTGTGATTRIGLLALSRGDGLNDIFRSLGAVTSDLGEVEKPPAGEIAAAAEALRKADVIVLPNHKNVVLAARQASSLSRSNIHIVETHNLPQGIAAALAFSPDDSVQTNLKEMEAARRTVTAVEVTLAAATRTTDGVQAQKGEAIALVDGTLVSSTPSLLGALLAGLHSAGANEASLITVYRGQGEVPSRDAIATAVTDAFPGAELEVLEGGQPLYPLIASIER